MIKKETLLFLRTSAMVMIFTLIKREYDCFEDHIVKT